MSNGYFRLGETDFGIGKVNFSFNEQEALLTLEIGGNQELTKIIANRQAGPFSWVLYPPKLYFREIPYLSDGNIIIITVDEKLLDGYDVALYLLEHNDIQGTLTIDATTVKFEGTAQVEGETMHLLICCENS